MTETDTDKDQVQETSSSKRADQSAEAGEQYRMIDFSKYEAEGGDENSPIRYFRHKENSSDRLVRLLAPGFEYPVIVKIPEAPQDPESQKRITHWKDIEGKVMLNSATLWLLAQIALRYNRRQPLILEGPPAVTKTFAIWVFAAIIGQPYARYNCSESTTETDIFGSRSTESKTSVRPDLYTLIDSKAFKTIERSILKKPEEIRTSQETDFLLMIELLREFKSDNAALDDADVVAAVLVLDAVRPMRLFVSENYVWTDTAFTSVIESGGIATLDEPNTIGKEGVLEKMLPILESGTVEMAISPARKKDGRVGVIRKSPNVMIVYAMNPPSVAGRHKLTDATESRMDRVMIPNITQKYIEEILTFFMTGNDPDVRLGRGKVVQGRRGVETPFKTYFENMPKMAVVIKGIAGLHLEIVRLVESKEIGAVKKDGGNYVFDQRKITSLMSAMLDTLLTMVSENGNKLEELGETDWEYVVKNALRQVYLSGLNGNENEESDYQTVWEKIEASPLWSILRSTQPVSYVSAGSHGVRIDPDKKFVSLDF